MAPMPLRRVWRIEDEDGYGPWQSPRVPLCGSAFDGVPSFEHPCRMPPFWEDYCLRDEGKRATPRLWDMKLNNHRFGFPSAEKLLYWCPPIALAVAAKRGFVVRVYGAEWDRHVLFRNQIVFDANAARVLRTLNPLEVPAELEKCRLQMAA